MRSASVTANLVEVSAAEIEARRTDPGVLAQIAAETGRSSCGLDKAWVVGDDTIEMLDVERAVRIGA